MRYALLFAPLLGACATVATVDEAPDQWGDATLRIVSPASGEFLALEEVHTFQAELVDSAGEVVAWDEVSWTASADPDWARQGASFEADGLDVGVHDITAEVELPNGDRLAHTVGGVLLQSKYAGTYSGLFNSQVTYDQYAADCSGTVLLIVDPYGDVAAGDASCLASLMGFDAEVQYVFDLNNDTGSLSGTAGVDLFGWYTLDFPAQGTLDPADGTMDISFGGDGAQIVTIDGSVEADRVSLDAGL